MIVEIADASIKAIWAEKPLAFSLQDADDMVAVCPAAGSRVGGQLFRRWNPFFSTTRRLIDAGELGAILQVTGYSKCSLSHNGSHLLDTICYLAGGQVQWVFGEMESDAAPRATTISWAMAIWPLTTACTPTAHAMPTGAARWGFDVIGERGRVRLAADGQQAEWYRLVEGGLRNRGVPAQTPLPWPATMQGMGLTIVDDIVHAIETGQPPRCAGEDGLAGTGDCPGTA